MDKCVLKTADMPSTHPTNATPARYVVGFDLGTTNSAVCYVDTQETPWKVRTFAVPQLVAAAQVEALETLPSFHYQPAAGEMAGDALKLPWTEKGERGEGRGERKTSALAIPRRSSSLAPHPSPLSPSHLVGLLAREQGTLVPGRLINSAKSWLCHTGVDRTAAILPWRGAEDVEKLSPVEVSSRYLAHVCDAWNDRFPRDPLSEQDFVLTLPASFDEVARELTVRAAAAAGLPRVVLIEEPQAAFYAWIYAHQADWEQLVSPGQKILICDIGGGTSDFTLIRVRRGEGGRVQFHRVAVGDHLILGGDNLDLALAKYIEQKIEGRGVRGEGRGDENQGTTDREQRTAKKLDPRQWSVLTRICRAVKETLLGPDAPERYTVNLPGGGSRLIGGGIHIEVTREEVQKLLVDGFFPQVGLDAKPLARRSGFQEFGLPFAADPAITKYLAAFLTAHRHVALDDIEPTGDHDTARPDIVLLNGGVFESPVLKQRLLKAITSWFSEPRGLSPRPEPPEPTWQPILLDNDRLDLAVARGAAYYGMVRRGQGVRIAAGLARTYYIGVEGEGRGERGEGRDTSERDFEGRSTIEGKEKQQPSVPSPLTPHPSPLAICLVPAKAEPGQDIEMQRKFNLLVSEPVEFPLFISSTRLTDLPGELVPIDRERMTPLPPIRTVMKTQKKGEPEVVPVHLHSRLTEIGTLDLWCSEIDGRRSWRLQFDVRSATQTDVTAHESAAESEGVVDEAVWQQCRALIENTFGPGGADKPEGLAKRLAEATAMNRNAWPSSLCRRIWESLMEHEGGRRRNAVHEARWLNLLGFALRPGYGLAVDDWRVAQTWTALAGKFAFPASRAEGWILWRRIGGGLAAGQQQALAEPLLGPVRALHRQLTTGKGRAGDLSFASREMSEMWRLLGSLELLPLATKIELGTLLLELLPKRKIESVRPAIIWALGRIAARAPMYGPLNAVVPPETAAAWLTTLVKLAGNERETPLCVMQLARRTDDRYRDLSDRSRQEAADYLRIADAPPHFLDLIRRAGALDSAEQSLVFGESLPKGLRVL
jgi:molecular chaperone DnaK (HSP70)